MPASFAQRLSRLRPFQIAALAGLIAGVLYLLLLTQQYSGDGLRWYASISGAAPLTLGGTNHLLFPVIDRFYFQTLTALGVPAAFNLAQSINAIFGGLGIACFAYLLFIWTRRWSISIGGAAILAFSRAYSINATDMTEPMIGTALVLFAIALISRFVTRQHRRWLISAAAIGIAIGAAIYQGNALSLIGACAILWLCDPNTSRRSRLINVGLCVVIAGAATLAIFIGAFLIFGGATSIAQALALSLRTESDATLGIYTEFSLRRIGVSIFGFGDALFGLRGIDGEGTNFFSHGLTPQVIWSVLLVGWSVMVVATIAAPYIFRRLKLSGLNQRLVWAGLVWFLPWWLFLVFWGARQSKLWIMPLAGIILILSILAQAAWGQLNRSGNWLPRIYFGGLLIPIAIGGLIFNLAADRITPNPGLQDTADILSVVKPNDLIISDWGGTPYPLPPNIQSISLVETALKADLDAQQVHDQFQQAIDAAAQRGRAAYIYGLLDLSAAEWDVSMGQRLKLPYSLLDDFKQHAVPVLVLRLQTPDGTALHLWKWEK